MRHTNVEDKFLLRKKECIFFEKKNVFFSVLSGFLSIIIINFVIYEGIVYINKIIAEITQAQVK